METLKEKIDRLGKSLNVEVLTNNFTAPNALYGMSDEWRKEVISLLTHWALLCEERLESKCRELARQENPESRFPDAYEYMRKHGINYYQEIEGMVEDMWQKRVMLDNQLIEDGKGES